MEVSKIAYNCQDDTMNGYYAIDQHFTQTAPLKPLVLVCHDWSGCNEFAVAQTKAIAALGYIGFAVDMYGQGRCGSNNTEKSALMTPLLANRGLIITRLAAALNTASQLPGVAPGKIAVIGFCFGGLCALDLMRSGADIAAIVGFHSLLTPLATALSSKSTNKTKVLMLHGYADPLVSPSDINTFAQEMTNNKVDWQINMYGNALHAFSNPQAQDPEFGAVYNPAVAKSAWHAMQYFLHNVFSSC
jgi:dienelactone hydrolase